MATTTTATTAAPTAIATSTIATSTSTSTSSKSPSSIPNKKFATSTSTTTPTLTIKKRREQRKPKMFVAKSKRALSRSVRAMRARKIREQAKNLGNVLTRSRFFRALVDWAYGVCDSSGTGQLNKDELYAGLLLVHIKLAKFAGPAACFPPSRTVVGDLFEASDADHSGGICRQEFNIILSVCCAQIFSRILLNYATMILVIPFVARKIVDRFHISENSYTEMVCEQLVGLMLFLLIIPILWNRIDKEANQSARREAERQRSFRGINKDEDKEKDKKDTTTSTTNDSSTVDNNNNNNKKKMNHHHHLLRRNKYDDYDYEYDHNHDHDDYSTDTHGDVDSKANDLSNMDVFDDHYQHPSDDYSYYDDDEDEDDNDNYHDHDHDDDNNNNHNGQEELLVGLDKDLLLHRRHNANHNDGDVASSTSDTESCCPSLDTADCAAGSSHQHHQRKNKNRQHSSKSNKEQPQTKDDEQMSPITTTTTTIPTKSLMDKKDD